MAFVVFSFSLLLVLSSAVSLVAVCFGIPTTKLFQLPLNAGLFTFLPPWPTKGQKHAVLEVIAMLAKNMKTPVPVSNWGLMGGVVQ